MSNHNGYVSLNTETVIDYVKKHQFFHEGASLRCEEIGDGNLNYVFRIEDPAENRSIIVKQALPYAKVVGESWPLTLDRARIESEHLKLAAQYVPELVPEVYKYDEQMALTVMEDLRSYVVLRKGQILGNMYPHIAKHAGEFMAKTLFYTSDFGMNQQDKKRLAARFCNPELCKITEDLYFTDPFFDQDTNDYPSALQPDVEEIWRDEPLKSIVASLKWKFLTCGQALLHGDLHSGSIFVNENETKMIDPEFAFMGPIGFDVGSFIANMFLNMFAQQGRMNDEAQRAAYNEHLVSVIEQTWDTFKQTFIELWTSANVERFSSSPGVLDDVLHSIFQDAVGFAGCEMIRRTIGLAHVEDIDGIEDENVRLQVQKRCLQVGKTFIKHHREVQYMSEWLELAQRGGSQN